MSGFSFAAVVDSGVGGLTVLRQLRRQYPHCNFVYFADSAHCPYGTQSDAEIFSRVSTVVDWLVQNGANSVVLACNTASVFADRLRSMFPLPIYDVVTPTCRLAARLAQGDVAVLATDATVRSGIYVRHLAALGVASRQYACSALVPFAEHNAVRTDECRHAVRLALAEPDAVILGCTHFPLLLNVMRPYIGHAQAVQCVTDFVPVQHDTAAKGKCLYLTSGDPVSVTASAQFARAKFVHVDV